MDLRTYLAGLQAEDRSTFAARCGSSVGHIRNISYGYKPCGEALAIAIERESGGRVSCEELRPDVDWQYLRGTSKSTEPATAEAR